MSARIYMGRIPSRASERDVEHFFRGYGRVRDVLLKNGFGFVEFDDKRDAEDAVYDLNGKELLGERVVLDYSKPRGGGAAGRGGGRFGGSDRGFDRGGRYGSGPPKRESRYGRPYSTRHRVVVSNLSTRISWQDLKDEIRRNGVEPTYAEAHRTPNEASVCFASSDDLRKCVEKCDGLELNGRKIKITEDTRSGGRSRSRSRSPGNRRRSRSRGSSHSSRSRSPKRRRANRSRSNSRSKSPERKSRSASRSPPPKRGSPARSESGSPKRYRSRSGTPDRDNGDN